MLSSAFSLASLVANRGGGWTRLPKFKWRQKSKIPIKIQTAQISYVEIYFKQNFAGSATLQVILMSFVYKLCNNMYVVYAAAAWVLPTE